MMISIVIIMTELPPNRDHGESKSIEKELDADNNATIE
jgi:hypothetical protein